MIQQGYNRQPHIALAIVFALVCLALSSVSVPMAKAQTKVASPRQFNASGHITILIVGMSSSMETNDPHNLRCAAVDAAIEQSKPGDMIGAIGLNSMDNTSEGNGAFPVAQEWVPPTFMIPSAQTTIRENISQLCHATPSGSTPTYDALQKALTMLTNATQGGQLSGSVLLLSDGQPSPDPYDQAKAIQRDLIPQFLTNNWPIDTVSLGAPSLEEQLLSCNAALASEHQHRFLSDLTNCTHGIAYSDYNTAPNYFNLKTGISPLNLTQFFTDTYQHFSGQEVTTNGIKVTQLSSSSQPFPYTFSSTGIDNLDIIVVKDTPKLTVTLQAPPPENSLLPPRIPGTYVLADNDYYTVFSIQQSALQHAALGGWKLMITGVGSFLMKFHQTSSTQAVQLAPITSPAIISATNNTPVFPLEAPLDITAKVTNVSDFSSLRVSATLTYSGTLPTSLPKPQSLPLTYDQRSMTFIGQFQIPALSLPEGTYRIFVTANDKSRAIALSSDYRPVILEHFPFPFIIDPQTHKHMAQIQATPVNYPVKTWDAGLRWLFSPPISFNHWWFVHNLPPQPIRVPFDIELNGLPYTRIQVTAIVTSAHTSSQCGTTPATSLAKLIPNKEGNPFLLFTSPDAINGTYEVTFCMSGTLPDGNKLNWRFGDKLLITRPVHSFWQEERAEWEPVGFYFIVFSLLCFFCVRGICWILVPVPFGECLELANVGHGVKATYSFQKANYNYALWFLWRHTLRSEQVIQESLPQSVQLASINQLPRGLKFHFCRGFTKVMSDTRPRKQWLKYIEVRPYNRRGRKQWQLFSSKSTLKKWSRWCKFQRVSSLHFTDDHSQKNGAVSLSQPVSLPLQEKASRLAQNQSEQKDFIQYIIKVENR